MNCHKQSLRNAVEELQLNMSDKVLEVKRETVYSSGSLSEEHYNVQVEIFR